MTNKEQNRVLTLAGNYLERCRDNLPARYKLVYVGRSSLLSCRDTLESSPSEREWNQYLFACRYLSSFEVLCQVLHLLKGTTYASLYDSFGIPFGGAQ